MSHNAASKRLATLEQAMREAGIEATKRWVGALADTELDVLLQDIDPAARAELEAMSDAEIEQRLAGCTMSVRDWEAVREHWRQRLAELGIASPSQVFADVVGLNITRGIVAGIAAGRGDIERAVGGLGIDLARGVSLSSLSLPSLPSMAMPSFDDGPGRGSGDVHLHLGPIDLRGSDLSLRDVEDRVRMVMNEAKQAITNELLPAARSLGLM